ncbi:MAG: sigma-70 family RNA polymerase sigma factor [Clostridia bacterium]|nr:sigma-70 family RNA polymerase sigma factor [Clostridia bacterium]
MKALLGQTREVNNMDDLRIIDLYFERDEQAIKETDAKYGKLCHSIAYNVLHDHEDSEECVNDTYVGVWNAIPPTRPNNLMSFVCKIARNLSLKRFELMKREKRTAEVLLSLDELAAVLPDERYAPDVSDEDVGKLISAFLRNQKEEARNVFILKYFFFDTIGDIAERFGFTESKVKNMLFYTRNKLRDYLIKEGVEI